MTVPNIDSTATESPFRYDTGFRVFLGIFTSCAMLEFVLYGGVFTWGCGAILLKKSSDLATRVLAGAVFLSFWALRLIYIPVLLYNIPYSSADGFQVPETWLNLSIWLMAATYALVLVLPMAVVLGKIVWDKLFLMPMDNETVYTEANWKSAPLVCVIMPVYNELPDILFAALLSLVESNWPKHRLHVFVSFDDDSVSPLYLSTLKSLGIPPLKEYPKVMDLEFRGIHVTVSRFPHGGKSKTQQRTFDILERYHLEDIKAQVSVHAPPLLLLLVDSDIVLDVHALQHMAVEMTRPNRQKIAMTGLVTCKTSGTFTWLQILQDIEYIQGQCLDRVLESFCGAVTCLPGAFTLVRYDSFRDIAQAYFGRRDPAKLSTFDYYRFIWGEDRYLTQLLMKQTPTPYQVSFADNARCKTIAPAKLGLLMKQRRRWFLGVIANEIAMLTSPTLWRRYPFLLTLRLFHDSLRSLTLLFFVIAVTAFTYKPLSAVALIAIFLPLILNWLFMIFFGISLHRYKAFLYPAVHIVYPFFLWGCTVYSVTTATMRSWGTRGVESTKEITRQTQSSMTAADANPGEVVALYSEEYDKFVYMNDGYGKMLNKARNEDGTERDPRPAKDRSQVVSIYNHQANDSSRVPNAPQRGPTRPPVGPGMTPPASSGLTGGRQDRIANSFASTAGRSSAGERSMNATAARASQESGAPEMNRISNTSGLSALSLPSIGDNRESQGSLVSNLSSVSNGSSAASTAAPGLTVVPTTASWPANPALLSPSTIKKTKKERRKGKVDPISTSSTVSPSANPQSVAPAESHAHGRPAQGLEADDAREERRRGRVFSLQGTKLPLETIQNWESLEEDLMTPTSPKTVEDQIPVGPGSAATLRPRTPYTPDRATEGDTSRAMPAKSPKRDSQVSMKSPNRNSQLPTKSPKRDSLFTFHGALVHAIDQTDDLTWSQRPSETWDVIRHSIATDASRSSGSDQGSSLQRMSLDDSGSRSSNGSQFRGSSSGSSSSGSKTDRLSEASAGPGEAKSVRSYGAVPVRGRDQGPASVRITRPTGPAPAPPTRSSKPTTAATAGAPTQVGGAAQPGSGGNAALPGSAGPRMGPGPGKQVTYAGSQASHAPLPPSNAPFTGPGSGTRGYGPAVSDKAHYPGGGSVASYGSSSVGITILPTPTTPTSFGFARDSKSIYSPVSPGSKVQRVSVAPTISSELDDAGLSPATAIARRPTPVPARTKIVSQDSTYLDIHTSAYPSADERNGKLRDLGIKLDNFAAAQPVTVSNLVVKPNLVVRTASPAATQPGPVSKLPSPAKRQKPKSGYSSPVKSPGKAQAFNGLVLTNPYAVLQGPGPSAKSAPPKIPAKPPALSSTSIAPSQIPKLASPLPRASAVSAMGRSPTSAVPARLDAASSPVRDSFASSTSSTASRDSTALREQIKRDRLVFVNGVFISTGPATQVKPSTRAPLPLPASRQ